MATGVLDLRLARHQLDMKAVVELEELLRFLSRERLAGAAAFLRQFGRLLGWRIGAANGQKQQGQ